MPCALDATHALSTPRGFRDCAATNSDNAPTRRALPECTDAMGIFGQGKELELDRQRERLLKETLGAAGAR